MDGDSSSVTGHREEIFKILLWGLMRMQGNRESFILLQFQRRYVYMISVYMFSTMLLGSSKKKKASRWKREDFFQLQILTYLK